MRSDDEIRADLKACRKGSFYDASERRACWAAHERLADDVEALLARAQRAEADARVYQELYEQRVGTLVETEADRDRLAAELAEARAENERLHHVLRSGARAEVETSWQERDALAAQVRAVEALHQPEKFTRSVPVFDEFDSPWQRGTQCKSCRNGRWPCETVAALAVSTPDQPEPESKPKCICIRLNETGGLRIANRTCPVHGVNGTEPADGYDVPETER